MSDQSILKTLNNSSSSSSTNSSTVDSDQPPLTRNSSFSKLNAKAPEFVPMKPTPSPPPPPPPNTIVIVPPPPPPPPMVHVFAPIAVRGVHHHPPHVHHHFQPQLHDQHRPNNNNNNNSSSINNDRHQKKHGSKEVNDKDHGNSSSSSSLSNGLSDEAAQKLINQVEYYFSDVNLATTDHLIKFIFKDPEGFVPISVVASFKKIKALISSNSQLAAVLRNSTKLAVSEDGKKVKRVHPLKSSDMEELQARIIVAENLPDDHCHQNLMKIFSAVGSVKSIRTCLPQPSNNGASSVSRSSKNDNHHYNNKLHAFVEYDSVELAEKAIVELNVDSWRNGLRARPLLKQVSKPSPGRAKKTSNEGEFSEEVSVSTSEQNHNDKPSEHITAESDAQPHEQGEDQSLDKEGGQKKNRNRGKGKGRGRGHNNNNNHSHHQQTNRAVSVEQPPVVKQPPPGPRMPDGTRGFSMGRGKPLAVNTS